MAGQKLKFESQSIGQSCQNVRLWQDCVEKVVSCDARGSLIQSLHYAGLKIMMGHRQVGVVL